MPVSASIHNSNDEKGHIETDYSDRHYHPDGDQFHNPRTEL